MIVGLPCAVCRKPRPIVRSFMCGPSGCEIEDKVERCSCMPPTHREHDQLLTEGGYEPFFGCDSDEFRVGQCHADCNAKPVRQ